MTAHHRHRWDRMTESAEPESRVLSWFPACRCGAVKDPAATSKGRSSSRLGKDQERRIEKAYGPRKVGEFGDAIDLVGRVWKWQSKATRAPVPKWVGTLGEWGPIGPHLWITEPIEHMEPLRRDLRPLLIRTWVRVGVLPVDIIIVRCSDWAEEHGCPVPMGEFVAMTGRYFLECHGADRP